jgi:hypothetical protein
MGFRFESKIEVHKVSVVSVIEAFKMFPEVPHRILSKHGVGELSPDGRYAPPENDWHPVEPILAAIHEVSNTIGRYKMFDVGKLIPKNVVLPPTLRDIHACIQSIDVHYHLHHRKNGQVMFNTATGAMLDGIGHYGYTPKEDRRIVSVCENPYPCDFDRGILLGMARLFEPRARVEHVDSEPCRRDRAPSCTYEVIW